MTSIEKIRAEIEAIQTDHFERQNDEWPTEPYCAGNGCDGNLPCLVLTLAEDKLKLAEALEVISTREEWDAQAEPGERTPSEMAERVMAEVAR